MTQELERPDRGTASSKKQGMLAEAWAGLLKPVFIPASLVIIGLIVGAAIYGARGGGELITDLNSLISDGVGWWYILAATGFVLFSIYCAVSRIGNIKLGRDNEEPEFGVLSWFAMLFSAGMGIGLVFYGVAEPLAHYITPPEAGGVEGATDAAANQALELTIYHWGLHAWAIYVVVGLGLAYMTYRKGRPLAVRWLLEPLIGRKRVEGWIGHTIDSLAIIGTLFGVATSLGFGVQQIVGGLGYLGWVESSNVLFIGLIAFITLVAIFSVVSGVGKGLKWLSNINMGLAAGLAIFVLLLGPTLFLLQSWVQNLGGYAQALPGLSLRTAPFSNDDWAAGWTIFYWGWWISWAPFVGMFIARISRGRTIRQFISGVLLAPTIIGSLWFTIFGDGAILRQRESGDLLVDGEVNNDTSLFQFLDVLPLSVITSALAIAVIMFFFVTSSDSGSLVIDVLSSGGELDPPKITRVYWCVLEGIAAAVLLLVGGSASLTALQTVSIATAAPFSIVLVLACVSLLKSFRYEVAAMPRYVRVSVGPDDGDSTGNGQPAARKRGAVSATLAGLSMPERAVEAQPSEGLVLALHDLPTEHLEVDETTGQWNAGAHAVAEDPLGGEVFETDEFADSAQAVEEGVEAEETPRRS